MCGIAFVDLALPFQHTLLQGRGKGYAMSFRIPCPGCGRTLGLREHPAGKKVKCPRCEHRFRVPDAPAEPPEEEPEAPAPKAARAEDAPPRKKRRAVEPEPEPEPSAEEESTALDADEDPPGEEEPAAPTRKARKRKERPDRRKGPLPDPDHYPRLQNGFTLLGCTWRVLVTDKHLVLFPIVSGVLFVLVLLAFLLPLIALGGGGQQAEANAGGKPLWIYPFGFGLAFALHFVKTFCKMALVKCALLRFTGSESSFLVGFGGALARLHQVLAWALVSATLGLILTIIEHIHRKVGETIREIVGAAWGTLTYFVVPVMVAKGNFPFQAIGRSVTLLCETWGKANESHLGLRYVLNLLMIPVILLLIVGVYFWVKTGAWVSILPGVIALLLHMAIGSALDMILSTALYRYAATGRVPRPFDPDLMAVAFATRLSESDRRFRFEAEAARWRGR